MTELKTQPTDALANRTCVRVPEAPSRPGGIEVAAVEAGKVWTRFQLAPLSFERASAGQ